MGSNATGNARINTTGTTTTTTTTTTTATKIFLTEAEPTLSEREQLKIEFYKTYDVMTGVRIAATLGGFFSLIVLLLVYKSRCKSSKQLEDPRLTAAAAAAVAEAEAEERALAAALEAIARLPPRPNRGPRRSFCVEVNQQLQSGMTAPRFASVGGGYEALLTAPIKSNAFLSQDENRRCSSVTCSTTGSSYLERRGSSMPVPWLALPSVAQTKRSPLDEGWDDLHYPIDIQVIQPTPELSPCTSEAGLHVTKGTAAKHPSKRAPLASMGSVDPPEAESSRSLGSDSVFLKNDENSVDTEDEVSGFSTDSELSGASGHRRSFLRVPSKKRTSLERWDGCAGCVPRRRLTGKPCQLCSSHLDVVDITDTRCEAVSLSTSRSNSSSNSSSSGKSSKGSKSSRNSGDSPAIELRHRPAPTGAHSHLPTTPPVWSQETLF